MVRISFDVCIWTERSVGIVIRYDTSFFWNPIARICLSIWIHSQSIYSDILHFTLFS